MALLQITYVSRATERFNERDLAELVADARRHNEPKHITGALYFAEDRFVQVLEGYENHLVPLYGAIMQDPRHTDVETISLHPIATRRFPQWGMCHLPTDFVASAARAALRAARTPGAAWGNDALVEILDEFERAVVAPTV